MPYLDNLKEQALLKPTEVLLPIQELLLCLDNHCMSGFAVNAPSAARALVTSAGSVTLDLNLKIISSSQSDFIRLIPLSGPFRPDIRNPASLIASRVRASYSKSSLLFIDCSSNYFHFGAIDANIGNRIPAFVKEEITKISISATPVFLLFGLPY
jgi:hypothetical protein